MERLLSFEAEDGREDPTRPPGLDEYFSLLSRELRRLNMKKTSKQAFQQ